MKLAVVAATWPYPEHSVRAANVVVFELTRARRGGAGAANDAAFWARGLTFTFMQRISAGITEGWNRSPADARQGGGATAAVPAASMRPATKVSPRPTVARGRAR